MKNIFLELKDRGLLAQVSHSDELEGKINKGEKMVFYMGFDPTADSLHVGSLSLIITAKRLMNAGHKVVVLVGGGTALIGDPSGKTEMRKMLSKSDVKSNFKSIEKQVKKICGKKNVVAFVDNASWLGKINYLDFLRDFGPIFKVNEMVKAESYRARLEREEGLTFLEFNYQLLQAYDYLHLHDKYNCTLQIGGDDQWSNILAGSDLIRRKRGTSAFAVTIPLITNSNGKKMGKTESGAVWLDPKKTSPFDFYQFWINTDDKDVVKFLNVFTFLSDTELSKLSSLSGAEIRDAKKVLAFEVTKFVHGEIEANKAKESSEKLFAGGDKESSIPTIEIKQSDIGNLADLLVKIGAVSSKSDARRLVQGGGLYIDDKRIEVAGLETKPNNSNSSILIRVGKKKYFKVELI